MYNSGGDNVGGDKVVGDKITINNYNNGDGSDKSNRNKNTPRYFRFGLPPMVEITGRDEDVKKLTELIDTEQRIVISGMSGVGKTSLSVYCAREWLKDGKLENVVFINTETNTTMDNSIRGLCNYLKIGTNHYDSQQRADFMQIVYGKFTSEKLLVIFDNVILFRSVQDYLPPKDLHNIKTIITSQNREFDFYVYKLKPLIKETCLKLIKNQFGEQWTKIEDQQVEVEILMERLQFLPLAVCQAVAHIKDQLTYEDPNYTVKQYLDNFEESIKNSFPEYKDEIYKKSAFTAVKMNISRLKLDKTYGELAKYVLYCMCYLDPSRISEKLFLTLFCFKGDGFKKVKRLLQKYSLVNSNDSEYINIHRLIQEICRILTKGDSEFNNYFKKVLKVVLGDNSWKYISHIKFLKPYIENFKLDVLNEIYREMYNDDEREQRLKKALESIKYDTSAVEGWTVMHYAVFENNWDMLNLLKKSGQKFRQESHNWSVLHVAMLDMYCDIERVLRLERGNVNVQTSDKNTALHLLLSGNHVIDNCRRCNTACRIIWSGYDNSIVNYNGDTVAHLTFINNHLVIMKDLFRYCNIDIHLRNNQGEDINALVKKKHIILYKLTSLNHDRFWYGPVQLEPLIRSKEGVALLREQLNQKAPDSVWESIVEFFDNVPEALRLAAAYIQHEQISITDFQRHFTALSEDRVHQTFRENCYGYDCHNNNILIYTILEILKSNEKLFYIILAYISCKDNWLDVNDLYRILNKYSRTNIDTNIKILKKWFLLEQNKYGQCIVPDTVKYITVMFSHERGDLEDVCAALISNGRGSGIAVRYLGAAGVQKVFMDRYNSERAARPDRLNRLCELKLVTDEDVGHFTALHWAVLCNYGFVIDELLRLGTPVNTATVRGVTPFHIAATSGYLFFITDKLLDAGGDVIARDTTGNTPAHWAALTRYRADVMDLRRKGAHLTIRNNDGLTPDDILKSRNL